jgi:hypothetical protein
MAREAKPTDFKVTVDGIGTFTFGRRKMSDQMAIHRQLSAIYGGVEPNEWLFRVGTWTATLNVMTVHAPDGWDIEEMDPLDDATYDKMRRVWEALREREETFRAGHAPNGEGGGAAAG